MTENRPNHKQSDPLGELISIYRGRPLGRRWAVILWAACLIILALFLAFSGWRILASTLSIPGYSLGQFEFWLLLAYLCLLVMGTIFLLRLFESLHFVAIHEKGIRWRMSGLRRNQLAWEQITGIATAIIQEQFLNIPLRLYHLAILYQTSGAPVIFMETVQEVPEMIEKLKEKYYPYLRPRLELQSASGQPLWFGPLMIQSDALYVPRRVANNDYYVTLPDQINSRPIPWKDINYLAVQCGLLVVKSSNYGTKHIPVSQIPNLEILLDIIEQKVNR